MGVIAVKDERRRDSIKDLVINKSLKKLVMAVSRLMYTC
jgi:hypothetical protein